jgi:hypothetical protein
MGGRALPASGSIAKEELWIDGAQRWMSSISRSDGWGHTSPWGPEGLRMMDGGGTVRVGAATSVARGNVTAPIRGHPSMEWRISTLCRRSQAQ